MNRIREMRAMGRLVRFNWKALAAFELFYKLAMAAILVPAANGLFNLAMGLTGHSYLTRENVTGFILNPLTLLMLLLMALLALMLVLIDTGAVTCILDQSAQGVKARVGPCLRFAVVNALRVWRPGNILLAGVLLLLAPLLHLGVGAALLTTLSIPDIIMDSIRLNRGLYLMGVAALLLISLLATRWLYAFHCFSLEGCSLREACKRSAALSRGHRLADYGALLLVEVAFGALAIALVFLLSLLATALGGWLGRLLGLQWLTSTVVWYAVLLVMGGTVVLSLPVSYGCVSALFYRRKAGAGEAATHIHLPAAQLNPARQKIVKALWASTIALILSGSLIVGYLLNSGALNPPIEYIRTMEITAHRGASAFYPENTMAAFRGARELGADWVELDVQQTRDGQIVVMHDPDTRRTTGVRGKIWNMTYEQVAALDAGSFFSPEFAGEPIPLLSEVAEYARDTGLRLNIELKPTGHETDFEQAVIDIVREYGIEDRCVITSQVYSVLRNVKARDEGITTVYVTSLAYGNVLNLSAADYFSVQSSSVSTRLVSRVHNAGKQIYAWTVNTQGAINRMIDRKVDNIITDNVELARQCVTQSKYSRLLSDFIQTLEEDAGSGESLWAPAPSD